jgi:hypothetical protein
VGQRVRFFSHLSAENKTVFDTVPYAGLGGGIVAVPADCKASAGDMKKGVGMTIYHIVENIEEVFRAPFLIYKQAKGLLDKEAR